MAFRIVKTKRGYKVQEKNFKKYGYLFWNDIGTESLPYYGAASIRFDVDYYESEEDAKDVIRKIQEDDVKASVSDEVVYVTDN